MDTASPGDIPRRCFLSACRINSWTDCDVAEEEIYKKWIDKYLHIRYYILEDVVRYTGYHSKLLQVIFITMRGMALITV